MRIISQNDMTLQLSKYTVELKDELTWWEEETLKSEIAEGIKLNSGGVSGISGGTMLRVKMKAIELFIISIKEGNKIVPFSEDWVKSLSGEDGEKLAEVLNLDSLALGGKKKRQ